MEHVEWIQKQATRTADEKITSKTTLRRTTGRVKEQIPLLRPRTAVVTARERLADEREQQGGILVYEGKLPELADPSYANKVDAVNSMRT